MLRKCHACLLITAPVIVFAMRSQVAESEMANVDGHVSNSATTSDCGCWNDGLNPFAVPKAEVCCQRTDPGSLQWKDGQSAECKATKDNCNQFCDWYCWQIPHPDDAQAMLDYLGEKVGEISTMKPVDILLARAAWQAMWLSESKKSTNLAHLRIRGIHSLHPVGSWREDTWTKTLGRRDAVLAATELMQEAGESAGSPGPLLTKADTESAPELRNMRSVTDFIAVPMAFGGMTHVLLEGNGRMKGLQLAQEQSPDTLGDLQVEVDLRTFHPKNRLTMQEGVLELWNQYVEEAYLLPREGNGAQLREYASFALPIVKCTGTDKGFFAFGSRGLCRVEDGKGNFVREIPIGTLLSVEGKLRVEGGVRYKLTPSAANNPTLLAGAEAEPVMIGNNEYLMEKGSGGYTPVWEYCRKCIAPYRPSDA